MDATGLRLLAQDSEGLQILAAAVQDAVVKPAGIKRDARNRAFGLELNRFQWERAGKRGPWSRTRSILAFSGVESAKSARVPTDIDATLVLLDVTFQPADEAPGGELRLVFAGGAEIRLAVECIDGTLIDTGPTWPTKRKPDHERRR